MDERRYAWLYWNNPAGAAKVWKLESGGELIGIAAAFPRILCQDSGKTTGYVLGDFCVSSRHRALGPAVKLQKACLAEVGTGNHPMYDFPSDRMFAVYKRLGHSEAFRFVRWARPLRSGRQVQAHLGKNALAGIVASALDFSIALSLPRKSSPALKIAELDGAFGPEFTSLADDINANGTYRSADYLTWRYARHPQLKFGVLTASGDGNLLAYLVYVAETENFRIVDLFGHDTHGAFRALVTKVIGAAHGMGHSTVSFSIPESHGWGTWLQRLGFRPRESSPVVFLGGEGRQWLLLDGDRES